MDFTKICLISSPLSEGPCLENVGQLEVTIDGSRLRSPGFELSQGKFSTQIFESSRVFTSKTQKSSKIE